MGVVQEDRGRHGEVHICLSDDASTWKEGEFIALLIRCTGSQPEWVCHLYLYEIDR